MRCNADVLMNSDYGGRWREQAVKKGVRRYSRSERVAQCTFNAVVEVDGVPMCRRHAGQAALDKWIDGELIEKPSNPLDCHPGDCECHDCWQQLEGNGPGIV